jgi:hypothetical protein
MKSDIVDGKGFSAGGKWGWRCGGVQSECESRTLRW